MLRSLLSCEFVWISFSGLMKCFWYSFSLSELEVRALSAAWLRAHATLCGARALWFFFFNFFRFEMLVSGILICLLPYWFCLNCSKIRGIIVMQVTSSAICSFTNCLLKVCECLRCVRFWGYRSPCPQGISRSLGARIKYAVTINHAKCGTGAVAG